MKGTLEEVLKKAEEEGAGDFVSVTLTDEEELHRPGADGSRRHTNTCWNTG